MSICFLAHDFCPVLQLGTTQLPRRSWGSWCSWETRAGYEAQSHCHLWDPGGAHSVWLLLDSSVTQGPVICRAKSYGFHPCFILFPQFKCSSCFPSEISGRCLFQGILWSTHNKSTGEHFIKMLVSGYKKPSNVPQRLNKIDGWPSWLSSTTLVSLHLARKS